MNDRTCQQTVRDENGARTTCDRPLPDTAQVCPACVRRMRATLSRCVGLWSHVEALVGRQLRLGGVPGTGTPGPPLHGPYCAHGLCEHDTCRTLWQQACRNRHEPPIPNETPILLNPDALEDAWAVENTLTTWARLLSEETGQPIPEPATFAPHDPALALPLVAEERCEFSDLPTRPTLQCACSHPRRNHP